MKKIILFAFISFLSMASYAQFSFGPQVGVNFGFGHEKDDYFNSLTSQGVLVSDLARIGFTGGLVADIGFGKISFRPEINYVQKGSKTDFGVGNDVYRKWNLNYVEIPLNVVYNLKIPRLGKVFFGLGPAVSMGIGGKIKEKDVNGERSYKVKFDGEKNPTDYKLHLKGLDIGANVLAGIQLKMGFFGRIGFTYDFVNLFPNKTYVDGNGNVNDFGYNNIGLNLCVGYMIGKK
ncbi:MAG: porin family protein [Ferruginibacter sp.]